MLYLLTGASFTDERSTLRAEALGELDTQEEVELPAVDAAKHVPLEFDKETEAWAYLESLIASDEVKVPDGDFAVVRVLRKRTLTKKPTLV